MKSATIAAGLAALAGIGVAAASSVRELSAKAADILSAYEPSGETQSCLMLRQIDAIRPIDDETFLVETNGGAYYVNHPTHACSGAARANRRLEYTTSQPTLCAGDIIRVVDNSGGFMAGSCALGQFERLIPKAPA